MVSYCKKKCELRLTIPEATVDDLARYLISQSREHLRLLGQEIQSTRSDQWEPNPQRHNQDFLDEDNFS